MIKRSNETERIKYRTPKAILVFELHRHKLPYVKCDKRLINRHGFFTEVGIRIAKMLQSQSFQKDYTMKQQAVWVDGECEIDLPDISMCLQSIFNFILRRWKAVSLFF